MMVLTFGPALSKGPVPSTPKQQDAEVGMGTAGSRAIMLLALLPCVLPLLSSLSHTGSET